MKPYTLLSVAATATLISLSSCDKGPEGEVVDATLNQEILDGFANNIAMAVYADLKSATATLYEQVNALSEGDATEAELTACRATWRQARQTWEQSEAFLFGPVSTEDIDPRIDTWPVNFTDLDAQLASGETFSESYVDNLDDALKGFHPIEYLLFGEGGQKAASELSQRDLEYLTGLALNLKTLTAQLSATWDAGDNGSYFHVFTNAGDGSGVYNSQREAFEEMVNAMAGICDEVANGKISDPFLAADPSLEESPFAKGSITDFTNNMRGVERVYLGQFTIDGKGLEDLVRKNNLQLDGTIKSRISAAINALNSVTVPFGEAITQQPIQVQNAIDAINALKFTLEDELLPFVQQHTR